jgi:hypothetical protein
MTTVTDSREERVLTFVAEGMGVKRSKLSLSSRLNHDLGIDGDEAAEFPEHFQTRFHVDLGELRNTSEYLGPEG